VRDPLRRFLSAYGELCLKLAPAACAFHPHAPGGGGGGGGREGEGGGDGGAEAAGLRAFAAYTAARPCWDEHVCDQVRGRRGGAGV
jgi:hypothetical protein